MLVWGEIELPRLTLAGLLMFGRIDSIHEAVRNYFLDYRELPAGAARTEWIDRLTPDGTWSGNLYDNPKTTRKVILGLCRGRFLTMSQLASLLDRSPDSLRQRFIKLMVNDEKVLERRFPQQPNHEAQAHRTRGT